MEYAQDIPLKIIWKVWTAINFFSHSTCCKKITKPITTNRVQFIKTPLREKNKGMSTPNEFLVK